MRGTLSETICKKEKLNLVFRDHKFRHKEDQVKNFQYHLARKLTYVFQEQEIITEWSASINNEIYSPRLDLAVGPFAIHDIYINEYDQLIHHPRVGNFLSMLYQAYRTNVERDSYFSIPEINEKLFMNLNARCFLSIEIENAVTQKHIIGGIVNASALGRVGILIPWNHKQMRAFLRALNYLGFLKSVGKNTFDTTNIFVITKEQIEIILESFSEERMGIG